MIKKQKAIKALNFKELSLVEGGAALPPMGLEVSGKGSWNSNTGKEGTFKVELKIYY